MTAEQIYADLQRARSEAARSLACNRNPLTEQRYDEATARLNRFVQENLRALQEIS